MAAKPQVTNPAQRFSRWRAVAVAIVTSLGIISLTGFMIAHWVERQILTTDNWVAMVGPLPQDEEVAKALSTYSVNQLFTSLDVQSRITNALPERAAFLSEPLADQLQGRVTNRAKQFVQGDRFTGLWASANRAAHQRLINSARGTLPEKEPPQTREIFNLKIPSLRSVAQSYIEGRAAAVPVADTVSNQDDVSVAVNLKTSAEKLKEYVRMIDFANAVLGMLSVACLLGAVAISYRRRRLWMVIGLAIVVISLLQLIGLKAVRPAIMNYVEDASYRPAAAAVYDTLSATFRRAATVGLLTGAIIFLLAWIVRPSVFTRNTYLKRQWTLLKKSRVAGWTRDGRVYVRQYAWQASLAVAILGLIIIAFVINVTWQSVIQALLWILIAVEIIYLVSARPGNAPMKQ